MCVGYCGRGKSGTSDFCETEIASLLYINMQKNVTSNARHGEYSKLLFLICGNKKPPYIL